GQSTTVRGEVHHRPWSTAKRPGTFLSRSLETGSWFRGAGSAEFDAERPCELLCCVEVARFFSRKLLEQCLVRTRQANCVRVEEDETLEIDLLHPDFVGHTDEGRELRHGLLQPREPKGDTRTFKCLAGLHVGEGTHIA